MRASWLLFVVVTAAVPAFAQAPIALQMRASETSVPLGETFRLEVILTVNGQDAVDELDLPDLTDFTVVRESESQQASFSTRNGRRAITVEHRRSFILRADTHGKHIIGAASATLGRDRAQAAPITMTITPRGQLAGGANNDNDNDNDNAAASDVANAVTEAAAGASAEPGARFGNALPQIFLELRTDRTEAFVGEQITVVGEIWSRVALGSWPRVPGQKPPGFVCLAIDDGLRPQAVQRSLRGQIFNVYPVSRDALFALAAGSKTLPGLEMDVTPAGAFFQRQDVRVRSAPLDLVIKPLPEPAPPEFLPGAVGSFELKAVIKPQRATVGVPVSVVVEISGWGNIDEVPLPSWNAGASVRTFPPTIRRERHDRDGLVAGAVVAETLVQPSVAGTLTIPAMTLVVFDTNLDTWVTKQTRPLSVVVDPAGVATTGPARPAARTAIAAGARPLALGIEPRESAVLRPAPVIGGFVAVVGAVVGVIGRRRRRTGDSVDGQRRRRQQDRRAAADAIAKSGDVGAAQRLLLDAVADRCGDDIRAVDASALPAVLVRRGIGEGIAAAVARSIVDAEAARFAPGGQKQQAIQQCLEVATAVDKQVTP